MGPSSGGGLSRKPRGPNSGPLQWSMLPGQRRKHGRPDPSVILAELPMDVVATLHVLVEIEFSRRERLMAKATSNLDVARGSGDDAVLI